MSIETLRERLVRSTPKNRQSFLSDFFRSIDRDHSKKVDFTEFKQGLVALDFDDLSENQMRQLFDQFDTKRHGRIDFVEFVSVLKPELPEKRMNVVNEAFNKLDVNKDGVLSIDDFRLVYYDQAKKHPNFVEGKWTIEQALRSFIDAFDTPGHCDGIVTRAEFLNYYSIISATIADDAYFVFLIKSCFGI